MPERSLEPAPATSEISQIPKKRAPRHPAARKQRDLAIFKKVEIEKLTQDEVAAKYRINRSRVSQIVKRVRRQLAQAALDDPEITNHLARQRLERALEKLRLEHALDAAAEAMRRSTPILVTNRAGSRGKGDQIEGWSETIRRDQPPNVQIIKTYLRVSHELGNFNRREIENNPVGDNFDCVEFLRAIGSALYEWKCNLHGRPHAPSQEFIAMVDSFVRNIDFWSYKVQNDGCPAEESWPPERHLTWLQKRREEIERLDREDEEESERQKAAWRASRDQSSHDQKPHGQKPHCQDEQHYEINALLPETNAALTAEAGNSSAATAAAVCS